MLYQIVTGTTLAELTDRVEFFIEAGYKPIGGVTIEELRLSIRYMQAMVKEEDVLEENWKQVGETTIVKTEDALEEDSILLKGKKLKAEPCIICDDKKKCGECGGTGEENDYSACVVCGGSGKCYECEEIRR